MNKMNFKKLLHIYSLTALLAIGSINCGDSGSTERIIDSGISDVSLEQKVDMKFVRYRDPEADRTGYVKEVTPDNFDYEVLLAVPPVVVDFTAQNCSPCYRMKPIFEHYAKRYIGMKFIFFDVDQEPYKGENSIVKQYGVKGIPVFEFFYKGEHYSTYQVKGAHEDKLESNILNFLKQCNIKGGITDAGPIPDTMKKDLGHVLPSPDKDSSPKKIKDTIVYLSHKLLGELSCQIY